VSDFVSSLRSELVSAAERQERRRLPALPRLRPMLPALAVAALIAIAAVVVLPRLGGENQVAKPPDSTKPLFGGTVTAGERLRTSEFFVPLELTFPDDRWIADLGPSGIAFSRQPTDINERPEGLLLFLRPDGGKVWDPEHPKRTIDAPRNMLPFLAKHPDIDAGPVHNTTLAGHPARVMDYVYDFKRPSHRALYCEGQGFTCTSLGPDGDFHPRGESDRIWRVETKRGPLYVVVSGWDADSLRDTMRAAQPILDTLKIDD
jgi:hypothetical protein